MHYVIDEISTDLNSDHTFVRVRFWENQEHFTRGDEPLIVNDFFMQLRSIQTGIRRDELGLYILEDGTAISAEEEVARRKAGEVLTFQRETVPVDVPAHIITNIEAYIERAKARGYRGDQTSRQARRDATYDPHGILVRPDVAALQGVHRESP